MPTNRKVLGVISSNIKKRPDLTPYNRGKIVSAAEWGISPSAIATKLELPNSTVRNTLKLDPLRNGVSRPRSGRPREYTERHVRKLVRYVRIYPKDTYTEIRKAMGFDFCDRTIKRMLDPSGITNWHCKKRPHLTAAAVAKRYAWCKAREHWTVDDFRNHMWSDECSAERGKGKGGE